jgi:hypothetical protein
MSEADLKAAQEWANAQPLPDDVLRDPVIVSYNALVAGFIAGLAAGRDGPAAEVVPAHEASAAKLRAESRAADGKPEGTRESLARVAAMFDTYAPDCFPANELGQVHFARAMMEAAADEIRAFLATAASSA